jgi:hypothetical protein
MYSPRHFAYNSEVPTKQRQVSFEVCKRLNKPSLPRSITGLFLLLKELQVRYKILKYVTFLLCLELFFETIFQVLFTILLYGLEVVKYGCT